jgi:hypothetical protein
MQKMINFPAAVIYCILIAGCGPTKPTASTTTASGGNYTEDLSSLRPKPQPVAQNTGTAVNPGEERKATPYVEPKFAVNKQVDVVLDSIDRINQSRKFVDGFTIQVYSGLKREDALNAKRQLSTSFPTIESEVQYAQPNFRVKAGRYYDRMNAQRDFLSVKRVFPSAILIPDRISLD